MHQANPKPSNSVPWGNETNLYSKTKEEGGNPRKGQETHIQPRILRHHPLNPNPHPFNHGQQTRTSNRTIPRTPDPTADRQRPTGEKPSDDGIIWILLLPHPFHRTVKRRKQATPDSKVAAEDGRSGFDGRHGSNPSFAVWTVAEPFDAVPDCAADAAHAEGAAKIGQSHPRAWISAVVHCTGWEGG